MSLYSSLTQVLAPFAARIKGIQTGYDGTEYENPGEAVREQINDLHVLIGHVPGEAIQASAVAYNNSNVAAELTDVNGRLQQQGTAIGDLSELETEDKTDIVSAINEVAQTGGSGGTLTEQLKQALLQIAEKVLYVDTHGNSYYNDLYNALYAVSAISLNPSSISFVVLNTTQQLIATTIPEGGAVTWASSNPSVATVDPNGLVTSIAYGNATITASAGSVSATCSVVVAEATVTSISSAYSQSGIVYNTDSLDVLKPDLVITAHWSNGTTTTVTSDAYTLSGTLTVGNSIVTASYAGLTATFNVNVTADPFPAEYTKLAYLWAKNNLVASPLYIATGIIPTTNTSFEYKISLDETPISKRGGGHFASRDNYYLPFIRYNNGIKIFANRLGTETEVAISGFAPNKEYTIKAFCNGTDSIDVNGEILGTVSAGTKTAGGLSLFTYNNTVNTQSYLFIGKLYYLKVYENNTLIRDYVPCKNESGVIGLFDMINENFVTSATSYTFAEPSQ